MVGIVPQSALSRTVATLATENDRSAEITDVRRATASASRCRHRRSLCPSHLRGHEVAVPLWQILAATDS